jgi:biotin transport system substrate-specific component
MEIPLLLGFNLLLIASAYLTIPLPFSPVPVTAQTLGVLLIGMVLGKARGTAVVVAYLLEGAAGLPVFAGGAAGPAVFVGPTAGYLLGFPLAAFVVGTCSDWGWQKSYAKSIFAMCAGTSLIFITGLVWLDRFVPEGSLLAMGLAPFIPGALAKIAFASAVLPSIWRFIGSRN